MPVGNKGTLRIVKAISGRGLYYHNLNVHSEEMVEKTIIYSKGHYAVTKHDANKKLLMTQGKAYALIIRKKNSKINRQNITMLSTQLCIKKKLTASTKISIKML